MWEYKHTDELYHHGIKGMKWGVRRFQNKNGSLTAAGKKRYNDGYETVKKKIQTAKENDAAYRAKMKKISEKKYVRKEDKQRANYASKKLGGRVADTAKSVVVQKLLMDFATGKMSGYKNMTNDQIKKEVLSLTKDIAKNFVVNEALSKSVSKKYNDDGKKINNRHDGLLTREDKAVYLAQFGMKAYKFTGAIAGMKYGEMKAKRAENEARFNSWGGRILEAKYDDIVGLSDNEWRVVSEKTRRR